MTDDWLRDRRLTAVLDSLADNIIIHDAEGRLVWMNRRTRETAAEMGLDVDALLGKLPDEVALDVRIREMLDEVRARGAATRELLFSHPTGSRWREDKATAIRAADGTIEGIVFVSRDIHARKVMEARIGALACVGGLPRTSDHLELLRGVAAMVVPELADWARAEPDASAVGDVGDALVVPVPGAHGAALVLGMTDSGRRFAPEDRLVAETLVERVRQIADNARLTEALAKSEARFRIALANSNIAVFEHRGDESVCWIHNPHFGRRADEPEERRPDDAASLFRTPEHGALVADAMAGARVQREIAFDSAGERRHVQVKLEPIVEGGAVVGVTGAAVDMTEARRAQDELGQALVFRERVLSVLGHDLGNPLAAVRGLAALLERRAELDADTKEIVAEIDRAARRMSEMIDTIIDFGRTRFKGGLVLKRRRTDIAEVAAGVIRELEAARPGRVVELTVDGDARGDWDSGRIAQALSNLVGNALTHGAHDRPVRVAITGAADEVRIAVTNEGEPIRPDAIATLFEPFRRGRAAEENRTPGLGLGLFIVREIARAHGGSVEVESTPAATTFTMRVPRS